MQFLSLDIFCVAETFCTLLLLFIVEEIDVISGEQVIICCVFLYYFTFIMKLCKCASNMYNKRELKQFMKIY